MNQPRIKIIAALAGVACAVAVWQNWPEIKSWLTSSPKLAQLAQTTTALKDLRQQVVTGGALRAALDNPGAYLTREGVISSTNAARQRNGGLPALAENSLLDQAAQKKLADMFAQQYFEHVNPQGKGPASLADAVGYVYISYGENLALGNFKDDNALVTAWMNSPGHRANILNDKYREIGVAVGQGDFQGQKVWLAVQEFGRPASSCPSVDAGLKTKIQTLNQSTGELLSQLNAEQAQLNSLHPQTQAEVDSYNQQIADYNNLVHVYNNQIDQLKLDTDQYNAQVNSYNACAGN